MVSQKSTARSATSESVHSGESFVSFGFSPRMASALDLPIIWMLQTGHW